MGRDEMLGRLVRSRAGHDLGQICLVIREEKNSVWLADGRGRSQEKPKHKNKKHLALLNAGCGAEEKALLAAGERLREEEIRKLIRDYKKVLQESEEGESACLKQM
ncbi:MAG: KOW domain-containing RNA-binding protein [Lachnospiraceae bacterium]|nr:KOW domain-containing RNA-binding protein [Lachnospiraceae bacterium]